MITSGTEAISPDKAADWLATSRLNRHLYNQVVEKYVRAIKADAWMVNGESIVFDNTGALVNGHHRLHACIKAGKPFKSMVVRGVESQAFDTFDSGKGRSGADVFGLQGYHYPKELSATLNLLWRYRNGILGIRIGTVVAVQELEEALRIFPEVVSSVDYCVKVRQIMSPTTASFIHCLGSRADQYKADQFIDSLFDGADLGADSPIRALRERMLQQKGRAGGKLPQVAALAISIKAWNYFYVGLPLRVLRWISGEEFPTFGKVDAENIANQKKYKPIGKKAK